MAHTSQSSRRGAALLVSTVAALGLLTACGNGGQGKTPESVSGTAAPATGNSPSSDGSGTASGTAGAGSPSSRTAGSATGSATGDSTNGGGSTGGGGTTTASGTRCHTSDLNASVGRNDPGAGQENFPIVLTNTSSRTCTVRGYPGAAFVTASGTQLGPDPQRETGTAAQTVTLKSGQSAWAGLTFSSPDISGAKTATPASLLITPPDEKNSLKVTWKGGPVPVSGNSSAVRLSVFSAGTGA
ncbi:DUF4232 domain-containing protein [Streptomyces arenae]|uniref:DUF4232 domain-containing protein n=1 Tax=Streptomyces arenae TaxID=29301 RepID=UPI0026597727|nr:DUF4232 domain-containing protein [Streptomyces arenae]MCG7209109.1 DUF4232 domain-containing protein [Streptomyces arenae]